MSQSNLSAQQISLALTFSLASLGYMPVYAQLSQSEIQQLTPIYSQQSNPLLVFNEPPEPPVEGEPGGRVSGGKRGPCQLTEKHLNSAEDKLLTALVPMYSGSDLVLGYTTKEHPTFWFYVPEAHPFSAEFMLQDEAEQTIYQTPIQLSATPGVVSVSLPPTIALEVGKRYQWFFSINCEQETTAFVHGWVQRGVLNQALKSQLEKASLKQRIALYAANGFWYEALTASAELRRTEPSSNDWSTLLKAVHLEELASEPLVDCCKLGP